MISGLQILPAVKENENYALDLLEIEPDAELITLLRDAQEESGEHEPEGGVKMYTTDGYTIVTRTQLGDPIEWISGRVAKDALQYYIGGHWRNNSIVAYLMNCPNNIRIYLNWS